jgi:hypothetical protein
VIVVDVGAMRQGPEESVHKLIARFRPDVLFAFDPHPDFVEGVECVDGSAVVSRRLAAWTHTGVMPLAVDGICTGIDETAADVERTTCFDLSDWLFSLPPVEVVLKLDVEGAEYPLLARLAEQGGDHDLSVVLVEWHPPETAHGWYAERPTLRCPVKAWE